MKTKNYLTSCLSLLFGLIPMQAQTLNGINLVGENEIQQTSMCKNIEYVKINTNGVLQNKITATNNQQEANFTFKATCGKNIFVSEGSLYNKENKKTLYFGSGVSNMSDKIPEGVYDAYLAFKDKYETIYLVIKENIEITDGAVVEFNSEEAVNGITFKFQDETGKELYCDRFNTSNVKELDGTVETLHNVMILSSKDYGIQMAFVNYGNYILGHEEAFFINTPSDKYYVGSGAYAIKPDFTKYVFKNTITDFKTQTIANHPENLVYRESDFISTTLAKDNADAYYPVNVMSVYADAEEAITLSIQHTKKTGDKYRTVKFWIDSPWSDINDDFEFDVVYKPSYNDCFITKSNGKTKNYMIKSPGYIGNKNTGVVLFNNGTDMYKGFNKSLEYPYGKMYPNNPSLAFDTEEQMTFGNSSPICSFYAPFLKKDNKVSGRIRANYIGRYGEMYEGLGEHVQSLIKTSEIESGKQEILIPYCDVDVDGIKGENTTRVVYDPSREDFIAPTFHTLSVLDETGKVNDRLETVKGAKIILTGADYDYNYNDELWLGYFTYKETAVAELYYSIHGCEDNWKKLDVNVVPEKLFEPIYGNYYEAALDDVDISKPNTWIDVKAVITDEAGNFQEQIIRPVFKVQNISTDIKEVSNEDIDILVLDNTISLLGGKQAQMNIYSVDGRNVINAYGNVINIAALTSGVYVLNVVCGNVSVYKKFLKK